MLQRQPETRRSHEGTAGRNDGAQPQSYPGLVSKQALQRQEAEYTDETATTAAVQRQNGERRANKTALKVKKKSTWHESQINGGYIK